MNAKLLKFGCGPSTVIRSSAFMIADLTTAEPKLLLRYMGEESYRKFREVARHQDELQKSVA